MVTLPEDVPFDFLEPNWSFLLVGIIRKSASGFTGFFSIQ